MFSCFTCYSILDHSTKFNEAYITSIIDMLSTEYFLRNNITSSIALIKKCRNCLKIRKIVVLFIIEITSYGNKQIPKTAEDFLYRKLTLDVSSYIQLICDTISSSSYYKVDDNTTKRIVLIGVKSVSID